MSTVRIDNRGLVRRDNGGVVRIVNKWGCGLWTLGCVGIIVIYS
jgi:hypothetical protein